MNEQALSLRLEQVGNFVPDHARLADIGSDHAYLPVALMLQKKIQYAVAGEVVQGPYESACKQVKKNKLTDKITVRLANGLKAIEESDQIDTVTICGMGGTLIRQILEEGQNHLTGRERLILQPNVGEATLRDWLIQHDYTIIAEEILEENQKIYEIIVAEKLAQVVKLTAKELMFGPYLMREINPIFLKKWHRELNQRLKVKEQLAQSKNAHSEKIAELNQQIAWIKEVVES
ncbi:tRNA (adenine(22)-N(1))-methyltransferase [Enterococcus columbae]|uniref:SAM-dependent methyltransferase n=1 Tax=Enterococcus columbae DSM 7374 = ATCC 51263 TaxID=1121865 RepID=S0KYR8_9ENTE|nr:tRNA (adenine(22)-N(1))-methyltransferase TrmK [Enterococcus columbae]EOT44401.1 SAM-dependent methyltransferase [Enterococcus columbae DSM 7374 = ATCC 51263]EOW84559.1 SAM-dependent methyltransferase [Enterococcus columbae DSM 7374 = ATCC 51263]OJG22529.1 SAM-dependent methyltransferase [Enterococcus columbae DSM 7374 = ATCC 51263]